MEINFKRRIINTKKILATNYADSVLLVSSAARVIRSRDSHFSYRQNSDFYYLTGSQLADAALLISSNTQKPVLFVKKPDATSILWEGKPASPLPLAEKLGCTLVVAQNLRPEILKHLKGHKTLVYQNSTNSLAWNIAKDLMALPSHERGLMPLCFAHSDTVLEQQRLYKDKQEINLIEQANAITNEALLFVSHKVQPGMYEFEVARTLEYVFGMNGAQLAFESIVAAGASAATLHYVALNKRLMKNDLLVIDCGAEYKLHCADITRVMPIAGQFQDWQRILYQTVLEAQQAAISKIKHGVKIATVYEAAARRLTEGLVELKVLKGPVAKLLKKKAFKPYFPHGIGHSLGLDTHDLSQLRGNNEATLEQGMVFTVEPGLYFPKAIGKVKPSGVRIEDNILVTKNGCRILSAGFPKEIVDLES